MAQDRSQTMDIAVTDQQRRAIEWDCEQALLRFYRHLDRRDYDAVIRAFVESGSWNRMGELLPDRAAIAGRLAQRSDSLAIVHVLSNIVVEVWSATDAILYSYVTVYLHQFGDQPVEVPAPLRDPKSIWSLTSELVLEDARWKLRRHGGELIMTRR